jgi:PAS domain S-box-containing protein
MVPKSDSLVGGPSTPSRDLNLDALDSADGLFCVDRDQTIVHWSASAERLLGVAAAQAVGKRCYEVLGAGQTEQERLCSSECHVIKNARRGRTTRNFDLKYSMAGKEAWLNVGIILLRRESGCAPDALHVIRDVTEWRQPSMLRAFKNGRDASHQSETPDWRTRTRISRRERQIMRLLASGASVTSIADALGLSSFTVRNHISRAMVKLGTHTRLEAVVEAARLGLV